MKQYLIYHLRWQLGNIYGIPCLWFLQDYLHLNLLWSLFLYCLTGAMIFWYIDKWIFKKKN